SEGGALSPRTGPPSRPTGGEGDRGRRTRSEEASGRAQGQPGSPRDRVYSARRRGREAHGRVWAGVQGDLTLSRTCPPAHGGDGRALGEGRAGGRGRLRRPGDERGSRLHGRVARRGHVGDRKSTRLNS